MLIQFLHAPMGVECRVFKQSRITDKYNVAEIRNIQIVVPFYLDDLVAWFIQALCIQPI